MTKTQFVILCIATTAILTALVILTKPDIPHYKTEVSFNGTLTEVKEAYYQGNHLLVVGLTDIQVDILVITDQTFIIKTPIQSK